jgi:hypothetical protein
LSISYFAGCFQQQAVAPLPTFEVNAGQIACIPDQTIGAKTVSVRVSTKNFAGGDTTVYLNQEFPVANQQPFIVNVGDNNQPITFNFKYMDENNNEIATDAVAFRTEGIIISTVDVPMERGAPSDFTGENWCQCNWDAIQNITAPADGCNGFRSLEWGAGATDANPDIRHITVKASNAAGAQSVTLIVMQKATGVMLFTGPSFGWECLTNSPNLCLSADGKRANFNDAATGMYFNVRTMEETTTTGGVSTLKRYLKVDCNSNYIVEIKKRGSCNAGLGTGTGG